MMTTVELVLRLAKRVTRMLRNRLSRSPEYVVKANTAEAFNYFYEDDKTINESYLDAGRRAFYGLVADYYTERLSKRPSPGTLRVADLGCGTGHMLLALQSKLGPGHSLTLIGVDFATSALKRAKALLPEGTFLERDVAATGLGDEDFDLVLCMETMEHMRQPETALVEALRICRPDGRVILTVPNGDKDSWDGHVNFWSPEQFRQFLDPYGIVEIRLLQDETAILASVEKPL